MLTIGSGLAGLLQPDPDIGNGLIVAGFGLFEGAAAVHAWRRQGTTSRGLGVAAAGLGLGGVLYAFGWGAGHGLLTTDAGFWTGAILFMLHSSAAVGLTAGRPGDEGLTKSMTGGLIVLAVLGTIVTLLAATIADQQAMTQRLLRSRGYEVSRVTILQNRYSDSETIVLRGDRVTAIEACEFVVDSPNLRQDFVRVVYGSGPDDTVEGGVLDATCR